MIEALARLRLLVRRCGCQRGMVGTARELEQPLVFKKLTDILLLSAS